MSTLSKMESYDKLGVCVHNNISDEYLDSICTKMQLSNILKPFILVHLSLGIVGLLPANTGKNFTFILIRTRPYTLSSLVC